MTPRAQRVAIAEACNWPPYRFGASWIATAGLEIHGLDGTRDYLNDLNAMAEAEKTLWSTRGVHFSQDYYENTLPRAVSGAPGCWAVISATAAERAEALLRTLGLWNDAA